MLKVNMAGPEPKGGSISNAFVDPFVRSPWSSQDVGLANDDVRMSLVQTVKCGLGLVPINEAQTTDRIENSAA